LLRLRLLLLLLLLCGCGCGLSLTIGKLLFGLPLPRGVVGVAQ